MVQKVKELDERYKMFLGCSMEEIEALKDENRKRQNYYQVQLSNGCLPKAERKAIEAAKAANQHEYDALVKARSIIRRKQNYGNERVRG